jgi:serine/threonine-protein kinase
MRPTGPPVDPLFLSFQLALAGRYSIDRELGRGGMGIVFLAREVHLDRPVAIKLLPPDKAGNPTLRERFLREARLAAKLSHPNIIPIHAVDETAGFVYYVMAFVDGETLANRVRTRGPLPGSEGARVMREVAWALAHAHSQRLVHRDVKPDNILLEHNTGRVLVADFGIAAAAGEAGGEGVTGTPEFMSPEQALGHDIDARSDLYGLGVTAFFMFSGRLPFEGKSATEVLAKQVTEAPPQLAALGLAVPRKLATLVDRCLAKKPAQRPATADALAEQLGLALEQRRELPAALRAFVKRNGRLDGGGTLLFPMALATGAVLTSMNFGSTAGFVLFAAGAIGAPLAYLVSVARHLSLLGFGHQDLGPAFKAEIERAREEHAANNVRGRSTLETLFRVGIIASLGGTALIALLNLMFLPGGAAAWSSRAGQVIVQLGETIEYGLALAVAFWIGYLAMLQRRRDIDTDFWSKLWLGRPGKFVFAIARKLLGKRAPGAAMTHRATELSIGMAAESLFENLPAAVRATLRDVPSLVHQLQDDAQGLRARLNDLQEALNTAGDAAISERYENLRADRDAVHAKLGEAVGALETIRLNLLRLHAGSGSIEGFTTHIELAAEVSAEVARLLSAQDEVERGLAFPREDALTPV